MKLKRKLFKWLDSEAFMKRVLSDALVINEFEFLNSYYIEIMTDFYDNLKGLNMNEFDYYVKNSSNHSLYKDQLEIRTWCTKCNRYVENENYNVGINDGFNCYCQCEQPEYKFDPKVLKHNINCLIWRILTRLKIWIVDAIDYARDYDNECITYHTSTPEEIKKNAPDMLASIYHRNYGENALLLDIYNAIDMLKSQLYLMTKNIFLNKSIVDNFLATDGILSDIRRIQNSYTYLQTTIQEIQMKLELQQDHQDKLKQRIKLLRKLDQSTYFKWIRNIRNKLTHCYINIVDGTYPYSEVNEIRKIDGIFLLLVYICLLFYTILDAFERLE